MLAFIREAYSRTNLFTHTIELISFKLTSIDLLGYLQLFDIEGVTSLKLVNTGLTDQQLTTLLDFITEKGIERLVLTGNKLTDHSITTILSKKLPHLKELYLGK